MNANQANNNEDKLKSTETRAKKTQKSDVNNCKKQISCVSWNLPAVLSKLEDADLVNYLTGFDIICLMETYLMKEFDSSFKFQSFNLLQSLACKLSATGRPSGGVIVLINKQLFPFITDLKSTIDNVICFKIDKTLFNFDKDIIFVVTYVHPIGSAYYKEGDRISTLEAIEDFLAELTETHSEASVVLAGDVNARFSDWSLGIDDPEGNNIEGEIIFERDSVDLVVNNFGKTLIELCSCYDLTPLHGLKEKNFPTDYTYWSERGNSVIDHFICTPDLIDLVRAMTIDSRIESDHMPITLTLGSNQSTPKQSKPMKLIRTKWDTSKTQEFQNFFKQFEVQAKIANLSELVDIDIDQSIEEFVSLLKTAGKDMERTITIYRDRLRNKPWFDVECREKKKEVSRALNKMRKVCNKGPIHEYNCQKEVYKTVRTAYQNLIKEKKRIHRQEVFDDLMANRNDSAVFWGIINKLKPRKQNLPDIDMRTWQDHFSKVLNPTGEDPVRLEEIENPPPPENLETIEDETLDCEITQEEVEMAVKNIKAGKSAGPDGIPPEFLKEAGPDLLGYFVTLFNKIYDRGYFPIDWSRAIIVPIFKKGDKHITDNYRGISLLNTTSKLFTAILTKRLYEWAELNGKIVQEQAGFRRGYSTIDHIFTLKQLISNCLFGRRRSKCYVLFVDFHKAFDTVHREKLWEVLHKQRVSDKYIKMLKAIYKKVTGVIRVGDELSDPINCPAGLKQGCRLSPTLFSLLINEIAFAIKDRGLQGYQFMPDTLVIKLLMFADDLSLISLTPQGLQQAINILEQKATELGLKINLNKTKVVVFRKGGFLSRLENWKIYGQKIETVNSYRYLGYTLTSKLSTDLALAESVGKAKKRALTIIKIIKLLGRFDFDVFFRLFETQAVSVVMYSAELWGTIKYEQVEKIQTFVCKRILGVHKKMPNYIIYGELGRFPLFIETQMRALKYWFKIMMMEEDRLPKLALKRELIEETKLNNWALNIKKLLSEAGFAYVWETWNIVNSHAFLKEFRLRLTDMYQQNWHAKCINNEKFASYGTIKNEFITEPYLKIIHISKFRFAFTRIRTQANYLNNNRRIYNENAEIKCPFCNQEETELHLLAECCKYENLRVKYIRKHFPNKTQLTLVNLLNCEKPEILKDIAMFAHFAFKHRWDAIQEGTQHP